MRPRLHRGIWVTLLGLLALGLTVWAGCTVPIDTNVQARVDFCINEDSLRVVTDSTTGTVTIDTIYLGRCVVPDTLFGDIHPQFNYPESDPCEYVGATNDWLCHSAEQSMRKRNDRYINHGERCIQEGPDQWGHYIVNCPDPT